MTALAFLLAVLACPSIVEDTSDPKHSWCAAHGFTAFDPKLTPQCAAPVYGRCGKVKR